MSLQRLYLLCLLVFGWMIIPSQTQDVSSNLFSVNFDDATLPDTLDIQFGTYTIENGIFDYTVERGGFLLIAEGATWDNYAIDMTMTILNGSVWIQARTGNDLCSGYYLTLMPDNNLIDISVADADCNFTVLAVEEVTDLAGRSITARLEVSNNHIRGIINGETRLDVSDDRFESGFPIINVFPTNDVPAHVLVDDIQISELTVTASPETTPETTITSQETTRSFELPPINEIQIHDDPVTLINSFKDVGLIPDSDGTLYTENAVSIARIGAWFEPLFDDVQSHHAVMSADIFFLPNSDFESCLLSARIERDSIGMAQRYLDVGINAHDEVFIGETDNDGVYSQATQPGLLTEGRGNILFIAYGDRLSVYVNGRNVFQNVMITRREGSFGISANMTTSYSVCHVTNIWLYTFTDS